MPQAEISPTESFDASLKELGIAVIQTEASAVASLESRIDEAFVKACRLLLDCRGRIVVCGIGKSGHIGAKLAATLASTGSPAFFLHAAEASHGDLGMLQPGDVIIGISYSGSSAELVALLPGIKRLGIPLISLCGEMNSTLSKSADVALDTSVEREACPLGLAPTASTTATLAMGDALAIAILSARGFDENDFARSHPSGRLGRRLLMRVEDLMVTGDEMPVVPDSAGLKEALVNITAKGLGMVVVANSNKHLIGVFTDGDLRRAFDHDIDIRSTSIKSLMTPAPITIEPGALAVAAVNLMQEKRITALPVVADSKLIGVITMHAMLNAGVV